MSAEKKLPEFKRVSVAVRPIEVKVADYTVRIWKNGSIEIRPKRSRKAEASALTSVDSVYKRTLIVRAQDAKPKRKHHLSRGLLRTERTRGV